MIFFRRNFYFLYVIIVFFSCSEDTPKEEPKNSDLTPPVIDASVYRKYLKDNNNRQFALMATRLSMGALTGDGFNLDLSSFKREGEDFNNIFFPYEEIDSNNFIRYGEPYGSYLADEYIKITDSGVVRMKYVLQNNFVDTITNGSQASKTIRRGYTQWPDTFYNPKILYPYWKEGEPRKIGDTYNNFILYEANNDTVTMGRDTLLNWGYNGQQEISLQGWGEITFPNGQKEKVAAFLITNDQAGFYIYDIELNKVPESYFLGIFEQGQSSINRDDYLLVVSESRGVVALCYVDNFNQTYLELSLVQ